MRKISLILIILFVGSVFVQPVHNQDNQSREDDFSLDIFKQSIDEQITSTIDFNQEEATNDISSMGEVFSDTFEEDQGGLQPVFPSHVESVLSGIETQSISTDFIADEVHSPGRDSYIIDFGYHYSQNLMDIDPYSIYDGWAGAIILGSSLDMSIDMFIPTNMTYVYNETAVAGQPMQVNATVYDAGPMSFSVTFTLGFTGNLRLGPSWFGVDYPLDMEFIKEIVLFEGEIPYEPYPIEEMAYTINLGELLGDIIVPGLGKAIASIFDIELILTPQIDVDLIADVVTLDQEVMSVRFKDYDTQSFFIKPPEALINGSDYQFALENFEFEFNLSLRWSLHFGFNELGPLSFLNKIFKDGFTWDFLTFPTINLPGGLPDSSPRAYATGALEVVADINAIPEFHVDTYSLSEDNSNGILDPDEQGELIFDLLNHGNGPSLSTNISYSSTDFMSLSGPTSNSEVVLSQEYTTGSVSFAAPVGYTEDNGNITLTISMLRSTGELISQDIEFTVRVLQPGVSYVNLNSYDFNEPNDAFWDAGESITLILSLENVGSESLTYLEVGIDSVSGSGFTSSNSYEIDNSGSDNFVSTSIEITSPSDITDEYLDIQIYLYWEDASFIYQEYWIFSVNMYPLAPIEDLVKVTAHPTDINNNNGVFDAGDTYLVDVILDNLGTDDADVVVGLLYTDDPNVIIEDEYLYWYDHIAGTEETSLNSIYMEISPFITTKTVSLILYIGYETWYGDLIIDEFKLIIDVNSFKLSSFIPYYSINNDINGVGTLPDDNLGPGLYTEMSLILELDEGAILSATATLTSDTENIYVLNGTVNYGFMLGDDGTSYEYGYNDLIIYTGANFAGGDVTFSLNITYYALNGTMYSDLYSINLVEVAQGDIELPTYSYTTDFEGCQEANTTVSFEIDMSDNVGIDTVYFFYYFESNDAVNWTIETFHASGLSGTLIINLELGQYDFIYGFAILDVSNNFIVVGDDGSLTIEVCGDDTSDLTDTTSPTDDTSSITTPAETPTAPTPGFEFAYSFILLFLGLNFRRRKTLKSTS
jgi:hypothetical protein